MGQDEDDALLDRQPVERAFQQVAVLSRPQASGCRLLFDGLDQADGLPSTTSPHVMAGVDQQPSQPGIEAVGFAQPWQIAPGADQRLLHGIVRVGAVAQGQPRHAAQPVHRVAGQPREGILVSPHGTLDQHALGRFPGRETHVAARYVQGVSFVTRGPRSRAVTPLASGRQ